MQLLKVRDFSAMFTDTFQFIKENFTHFLVNYLIVNGFFLIGAFVIGYYNDPLNPQLGYLIFLYLFSLTAGFMSISFVTIYMILHQERGDNFDHNDIISFFINRIGRIIIYLLISFLMLIPFIIIFYLGAILLTITIVGILLLPIFFSAFVLWLSLSYYEYLNTDKNYFDALGTGFNLFTKKFWATTGSTALIFFIVMVIYGLALGVTSLLEDFTSMNFGTTENIEKFQKFFSSPKVLVVATLVSIISEFAQISQGIIYFSQKEFVENITAKSSIDQIGMDV